MSGRRSPKAAACSCATIAHGNEHTRERSVKAKALTIDRICETLSGGGFSGLAPRRAGLQLGSHSSLGDARRVFQTILEYLGTWLQPLPSELQQTAPRGCLLLLTHPSHGPFKKTVPLFTTVTLHRHD